MQEFKNITSVCSPLQRRSNSGVIKKNKGGRPRKPNMQVMQIRLDRGLNERLFQFAKNNHTNKSSVIAKALIALFDSKYTV